MTRRILPLLLLPIGALAHAGEPQQIDVQLDSYSITPARINLKAGQPVVLKVKNAASFIPHNLVIKSPNASTEVKLEVGAGKSGEVRFAPTQPGSYEMLCDKAPPIGKTHREKGMHGVLVVE